MRVVHRPGKSNEFLWLMALAAGMAIAPTESALAEPAADEPIAIEAAASQRDLGRHRHIYELHQRLVQLLRASEEGDADAGKEAAQLQKEIARLSRSAADDPNDPFAPSPANRERNAQTQAADDLFGGEDEIPAPFAGESQRAVAAAKQAELKATTDQLARYEAKIRQLMAQVQQMEQMHAAPPIEDAVAQIFPLRHAKATEAAGTLESLFGAQVRVAVDERSNNLVVSGKEKSLEAVRALLQGLDEPAVAGNEGGAIPSPARTVLLRVFWLADGLPGDEGQEPSDFLPPAVIDATARLGLNGPRLVTQTVNSLAVGDAGEVEFATQVPAVLLGQPTTLQCAGRMRPMNGDRTGLNMDIHVSGPAINCELKGSLATPLGHYMVLGTANSVIAEPMAMGGGAMMGRGGFVGEGGFEMADPAAAIPGAEGGMGMEGRGMEGMAPQTPKFNTSRFAFVVQVIEGESYAPGE